MWAIEGHGILAGCIRRTSSSRRGVGTRAAELVWPASRHLFDNCCLFSVQSRPRASRAGSGLQLLFWVAFPPSQCCLKAVNRLALLLWSAENRRNPTWRDLTLAYVALLSDPRRRFGQAWFAKQ